MAKRERPRPEPDEEFDPIGYEPGPDSPYYRAPRPSDEPPGTIDETDPELGITTVNSRPLSRSLRGSRPFSMLEVRRGFRRL